MEFSEETRRNLSQYFFGKDADFSWRELAQHYRALMHNMQSSCDWISSSASDTLTNMDIDDEHVLRMWIAENKTPK